MKHVHVTLPRKFSRDINAGEHWVTVHPHGGEGHPILVTGSKGNYVIKGGLGGKYTGKTIAQITKSGKAPAAAKPQGLKAKAHGLLQKLGLMKKLAPAPVAAAPSKQAKPVSTAVAVTPSKPAKTSQPVAPHTAAVQQMVQKAGGTPLPKPGFVRFYHGSSGEHPTSGGGRWVTQDPRYARDFRSMGTPNNVHYVDIPASDPFLQSQEKWAETPGGEVYSGSKGDYGHFEAPERFAKQMKAYEPIGSTGY